MEIASEGAVADKHSADWLTGSSQDRESQDALGKENKHNNIRAGPGQS